MAARRHNLSRRAVLGAGVVAPAFLADARTAACPERSRGACPGPVPSEAKGPAPSEAEGRSRRDRWNRALAAFRRAEAKLAAFRAYERSLPPAVRAYPACQPLEERFGALDDRRLAALRRLLRLPAPDLPALSLKLDLAVADLAWELTGCESCLEAMARDARRLSAGVAA